MSKRDEIVKDKQQLLAYLGEYLKTHFLINPRTKKPYPSVPGNAKLQTLQEIYDYNFDDEGEPKPNIIPKPTESSKSIGAPGAPVPSETNVEQVDDEKGDDIPGPSGSQTLEDKKKELKTKAEEIKNRPVNLTEETLQRLAQIISQKPINVQQPSINVEQPEITVNPSEVNIDVEGVINQIKELRGKMIKPHNLRGIVQELKALQTSGKKDTSKIINSIESLVNSVPEAVDIQPIVDELLEVSAGVEMISEDIQELGETITTQFNKVSDYLQPLRNKTKEEIINEYERIGSLYFSSLKEDTREDLMKRLDILKSMDAQAKALAEYKMSNPPYIEKDFTRAGFDMFYKVGDTTPNNIPLYKKYKFIQKIPDIVISFDPKTGLYKCNQGNEIYVARNYKIADKWATLGGFYNAELTELRKMKIKMENLNDKFYPIFKARKL